MTSGFKYLDHTADVKFEAFGESLEEAFGNAVLAMVNVTFDSSKISNNLSKEVKVEGNDLKGLLLNFLEEFIFLLDSESFVPCKVNVKEIGEGFVSAEVFGGDSSEQETVGPYVKAVTYNDMIVTRDPVKVQVVLDI